jgi:glycosyltransferase involved in cell wall biosynthesis
MAPDLQLKQILFILSSLDGGGAERVMLNAIRYIDKSKYAPVIFIIKGKGVYWNEIPEGVPYIVALKGHQRLSPNFISLFVKLFKVAVKSHVIVGSIELDSSYLAAIMGVLLRRPRIGWVHTSLSNFLLKMPLRHRILLPVFYPLLNTVFAVSHGVRNDLIKNFRFIKPERILVMYNCIDVQSIQRRSEEHAVTVDRSIPIVLSIGRLDRPKGFDLLIKAHQLLLNESVSHRLIILGEGPERPALEAMIKELNLQDSVLLAGFQTNPFPWLKCASVFALSSRYEGFGAVIVEAMALGVPVVSTDCPDGPSEILKNGQFGLLVKPEDPAALAQAIREMLYDKKLREEFSTAALQRAREFSPDSIMPKLEYHLQKILARQADDLEPCPGETVHRNDFCNDKIVTPTNARPVLFILSNLDGGGAERSCIAMIRHMDKSKYLPVLFLIKNKGVLWDELPKDIVLITGLKEKQRMLFHFVSLIVRLFKTARKCDLLIGGLELDASYFAVLFGILLGKPRIGWVRTNLPEFLRRMPKRHHVLIRIFYPFLNSIIAVSNGVKHNLVTKYRFLKAEKIVTIPNIIDIQFGNYSSKESKITTDTSVPIILSVGRLDKSKGYDVLIRSHHLLITEKVFHKLIILGEGVERQNLEAMIRELGLEGSVMLPGFHSDLYPWLKQATAFVLSSRFEGFGRVIVEAMALGIPVVATDCPYGPSEILEDGKFGMLVKPDDHVALAAAMRTMLCDRNAREKYAKAGVVRAQEFVPEKILPQIDSAFQSLLRVKE